MPVLRQLRHLFLWSTGLGAKRRVIGKRAAHLLILHLWSLPIASIDVRDPSSEEFYTTELPQSCDRMIDALRGAVLAQAAELMFLEVADELLHGRHFFDRRSADRSLLGFCDGSGNILASTTAIIERARRESENISPGEAEEFMEMLSKCLVSHYYATILRLRDILRKQPAVVGRQACRTLIDACISRVPVNSLPIYCFCHTDPLKPKFEKAIARHRKHRNTRLSDHSCVRLNDKRF
jgi:hypothetical protein